MIPFDIVKHSVMIYSAKAMKRSQKCLAPFSMQGNSMRAADWFYKTTAWKECRKAYASSVGGLCEVCLSKGRIVPGEFVHHKIHLTPENVYDPDISLNWENLQLLCRDCHASMHTKNRKRYKVDELGRVTARE